MLVVPKTAVLLMSSWVPLPFVKCQNPAVTTTSLYKKNYIHVHNSFTVGDLFLYLIHLDTFKTSIQGHVHFNPTSVLTQGNDYHFLGLTSAYLRS